MSIKKEINKAAEKLDNAIEDKKERSESCFEIFKVKGITMVKQGTGEKLTAPLDSIGRMHGDEGEPQYNYCLREYAEKGYVPEHGEL